MDQPALEKLSDADLLALMHRVYRRSREQTAELVRILVVVHNRRLFLKKAHPSLFEFCVKTMGMSNASAQRLSTAARLAAQIPDLIERIARGEIHLTSLVLMRHHLTPENATELLELARGRTRFQVEELLASVAPRADAPARMRKLPMPRTDQSVAPIARPIEPLAAARYRVQFNADRETYDDIQQMRDRMRHSNPTGDLDRLFKFCTRAGLERLEARERGLLRQRGRRPRERAETPLAPQTRHVPRAIRRAVFARDGAQCTFHDEDGNRCCAKTLLELDHIDLYATGGVHTIENLRVRCRAHNRWHAEQTLGQSFIEKRIRERRATAAATSQATAPTPVAPTPRPPKDSLSAKRGRPMSSNPKPASKRSRSVGALDTPVRVKVKDQRGDPNLTSHRARSGGSGAKPLAKAKEPRVPASRGSPMSVRRAARQ